jgi:hypothetical protein
MKQMTFAGAMIRQFVVFETLFGVLWMQFIVLLATENMDYADFNGFRPKTSLVKISRIGIVCGKKTKNHPLSIFQF